MNNIVDLLPYSLQIHTYIHTYTIKKNEEGIREAENIWIDFHHQCLEPL